MLEGAAADVEADDKRGERARDVPLADRPRLPDTRAPLARLFFSFFTALTPQPSPHIQSQHHHHIVVIIIARVPTSGRQLFAPKRLFCAEAFFFLRTHTRPSQPTAKMADKELVDLVELTTHPRVDVSRLRELPPLAAARK